MIQYIKNKPESITVKSLKIKKKLERVFKKYNIECQVLTTEIIINDMSYHIGDKINFLYGENNSNYRQYYDSINYSGIIVQLEGTKIILKNILIQSPSKLIEYKNTIYKYKHIALSTFKLDDIFICP